MVFHEKWGSPAHNATSYTRGFPLDNPAILWYEAFKGHDLITIVPAAPRMSKCNCSLLPAPALCVRNRGHHWLDWCLGEQWVAFAPSLQTSTCERTSAILGVLTSYSTPWKCLKDLPAGRSQAALENCRGKLQWKEMGFEVWARWQRVSVFVCRVRPIHL